MTKKAIFALPMLGVMAWIAPRSAKETAPTAIARVGSLTERLVESGTVSSGRLLLYGSSISGVQVKIAELASEGKTVAPGDILVRFDISSFEQTLARETAGLRQAEAEYQRSNEELRIERLRTEGESTDAEHHVGYAKSELSNQADGKGRVALAEVEAAEADARREVDRARANVDDMRPMLDRGFITRAELDRIPDQALRRAEEQLQLAHLRRDALVGFERPAAIAQSEANVAGAQQAVARQRETARARIAEREAASRIAASRVDEVRARIALLEDQIARGVVRSEAAGMVVYRELFFGNDKRKPQVGDEIWSNQPLIALPDAERLTVETRIREIDLHHVVPGRRVSVTVPAYPGLELTGTVSLVGALAEQDPSRAGSKFFPVTVTLDGRDDRLRTGMTAQVDIEMATITNALLVPVQAIFDTAGQSTVYVRGGGGVSARAVTVSAATDREAAIANGVAAGEAVLLVDPHAAVPAQR